MPGRSGRSIRRAPTAAGSRPATTTNREDGQRADFPQPTPPITVAQLENSRPVVGCYSHAFELLGPHLLDHRALGALRGHPTVAWSLPSPRGAVALRASGEACHDSRT